MKPKSKPSDCPQLEAASSERKQECINAIVCAIEGYFVSPKPSIPLKFRFSSKTNKKLQKKKNNILVLSINTYFGALVLLLETMFTSHIGD